MSKELNEALHNAQSEYLVDINLHNNLTGKYDLIVVYYNKYNNKYKFSHRGTHNNNLTFNQNIPQDEFIKNYFPFDSNTLNAGYGKFIANEMIKMNREEKIKNLLDFSYKTSN